MQGDLARRKSEPSLTFAHRSSDSRTFLAARSLKYNTKQWNLFYNRVKNRKITYCIFNKKQNSYKNNT